MIQQDKKMWRSLIRFVLFNDDVAYVVIPSWDSRVMVTIPIYTIPSFITEKLTEDTRVFAKVNIDAETEEELIFSDWEEIEEIPKPEVVIEPYDSIDKYINGSLPHMEIKVDYDDVNHPEVEAAVMTLKELIERHWNEAAFKLNFRSILKKTWDANEYDLQNDYEDYESYLKANGI